MKLHITKLDNGWTLTIVRQVRDPNAAPGEGPNPVVDQTTRLAYETTEALSDKLHALGVVVYPQ